MSNSLLSSKTLARRFGYDEDGFVNLPAKISDLRVEWGYSPERQIG